MIKTNFIRVSSPELKKSQKLQIALKSAYNKKNIKKIFSK